MKRRLIDWLIAIWMLLGFVVAAFVNIYAGGMMVALGMVLGIGIVRFYGP